MRDETVNRLDTLVPSRTYLAPDRTAPLALDEAAVANIGRTRDMIEILGPQLDAELTNIRGMLLLFDILVGITIGTLPHDQDTWTRKLSHAPNCGTVRCVAGWLAQIGYPGSRPHYFEDRLATAQQELADGTCWSMSVLGAAAITGLTPDDVHTFGMPEKVSDMFSGGASLEDVWTAATHASGGVIVLPGTLVDRVRDLDEEKCR